MGVFAAYATSRGHALVDRVLYLPKSWTDDRERCRAARIADERAFATKGELARTMITRALASPLPIAWVTADSAYGQDSHFRRFLEDAQLSYAVAVPKSQQVHGPRIDHLIGQAPPEAWQRLSAGVGAKGERLYDWAAARLPAVWEFDGDEPTRQHWMLARRSIAKPDEIAYYLACAPLEATVADLVRVAGCRWKIEEAFQSAKNACGLDQYEVRRYVGWYRHSPCSAHTFLAAIAAQEREKGGSNPDTPDLVDLTPAEIRRLLATGPRHRTPDRSHAVTWSRWRRRHQAHARRCHYVRRGHPWAGHPRQSRPTHPEVSLHSPSPGR
ncbi:IS701 family transposase [Kitasatospora sp. NPDC059648]|uniref:IS701 family transposase n=1 Tax=Kitasatospora sp. NPDC059648 TaxID=3346894 RepID=UPI00368B069B